MSLTESPKLMERVAELRSKLASEGLTDEELKEAIRLTRAERTSALFRREIVKEKKTAKTPDGAALLAQLMASAEPK